MLTLVADIKAQGKRIAAKSAIMLNYVADRNVNRRGRYMPGSWLPIHEPARLMQARPDYVFILPRNIKDEIVARHAASKAYES